VRDNDPRAAPPSRRRAERPSGGPSDDDSHAEVPAEVQSVDVGLPNDELPDDETIVRDTRSE